MAIAKLYCISGIDTDIGKTIATGLLARASQEKGIRTITQKIVQTGCTGISEDIIRHRQIMGIEPQPVDASGLTCPYVFPVPCSPHLAAKLANLTIDCDVLRRATAELLEQFEMVFLEGAGGLFVPLNDQETFIDYLAAEQYPLILVSSSRLGSINHTLSALELARARNIEVAAILYNRFAVTDPRIEQDSKEVFVRYMHKNGFTGPVIDLYALKDYQNGSKTLDFSQIYSKEKRDAQ